MIHSPGYTLVGKDHLGNSYYQRTASETQTNRDRVVIFGPEYLKQFGEYEASMITPEWHGWLHHMTNTIPGNLPRPAYHLDKTPYDPANPYLPKGHRRHGSNRRCWSKVEAWSPK